jgi:hypothetical protein
MAGKVKLTEAQVRFLRQHLRPDLAKNGRLTKYAGPRNWVFVRKCSDLGIIEIVDPDNVFPYTWSGTRITDAGRAYLASSGKGD